MEALEVNLTHCSAGTAMAMIVDLPRTVVIALAHTLKHLAAFSLTDSFTDASVFLKFADRTHMLLNSNTLTNLSAFSQLSPITPVLTSYVFFEERSI
jgi:hypothetical protein